MRLQCKVTSWKVAEFGAVSGNHFLLEFQATHLEWKTVVVPFPSSPSSAFEEMRKMYEKHVHTSMAIPGHLLTTEGETRGLH